MGNGDAGRRARNGKRVAFKVSVSQEPGQSDRVTVTVAKYAVGFDGTPIEKTYVVQADRVHLPIGMVWIEEEWAAEQAFLALQRAYPGLF